MPTEAWEIQVLAFFEAREQEAQRGLVEQLIDVVHQIRYTIKEY